MLILPLEKKWYEKICSGEKTVEYREVKPYWTSRLVSFYRDNTEVDDNFHKYIVDWEKRYYNKEFYMIPEDLFVNYLQTIKRNGFTFVNAICKLKLGYTNTYATARVTKIEIVNGKDTDLHIDKPVYAIHLANVTEKINDRPKRNSTKKL